MKTAVFSIQGMTCGGCVRTVENILRKQPGIVDVKVELNPGQAEITYDDQVISPEKMKSSLAVMGYEMQF